MQQHEKNVEEVSLNARKNLQVDINEAEKKGEMPEEAVMMVETRAIVVFGQPMERLNAKKQWLIEQKKRMRSDVAEKLVESGKSYAVMPLPGKLRAEVHVIHEMMDVHMTDEARKRLFDKMKAKKDAEQKTEKSV